MKSISLLLSMCLLFCCGSAQKNTKPDKVTAETFNVETKLIDTNTNAIVLCDIGHSYFDGNEKGWFSLIHKRTKRIKILNKRSFDAANVTIGLYRRNDSEERLSDCKAVTYNLEGGTVRESKVDRKSIYKEVKNNNWTLAKFSLPEVKENSIIEYTYTIESDFLFNLQPWYFQDDEYPILLTEYMVSIPQFFNYVFLGQGYIPVEKETGSNYKSYAVSFGNTTAQTQTMTLNAEVHVTKWTARNVEPVKDEPHVAALSNNISKVEFQLSQYRFPDMSVQDIMGKWNKVAEKWYEHPKVLKPITEKNTWLTKEIQHLLKAENKLAVAENIYNYVRDNFTVTGRGKYFEDKSSLKKVFQNKKGNVGEINLLMIAMLRNAGTHAEPVLISTRDNGYANAYYPLVDQYNYLIAQVEIDNKVYYLDATESKTGFGKLAPQIYNGFAEVISKNPYAVSFHADSLKENKSTIVFLSNDPANKTYTGHLSSILGYQESTSARRSFEGKEEKELSRNFTKGIPAEVAISNFSIDSLRQYNHPLKVYYKLDYNFDDENIIYFNPMLHQAIGSNPFTAEKRVAPVEMPYAWADTYSISMEIPEGYKVEELPKSLRLTLNETDGMYEYIIGLAGNMVQLRSKLNIKKTNYSPEDYGTLRDFFTYIIKKQREQIVFKKIN